MTGLSTNTMNRSAIAAAGKIFREENISRRAQRIVISPIKEMSILADELRDRTGADIVSFGQGIPFFDTPAYIKQAVRRSLGDPATAKYTLEPGVTELRIAIGEMLEKTKGLTHVQPKREVMVTVGCQEAAACALASTVDEGDEVILPSPCFASHIEQVLQFGGIPKFVQLDESRGWRLDLDACRAAVTAKTKLIVISNPSNPTGAVLTKEDLEGLVEIAVKNDLIILSDETYDFLTYDGVEHFSLASFPRVRDRVILCGSFSKKYAMTGYRVGYAFADEGILDHMLKVHDALAICCPAISQAAALAALMGPQDSVQEFRRRLAMNRSLMLAELDKMSDVFEYNRPAGAYYILSKLKKPDVSSFPLSLKILEEAHVVVIPGAAFGPGGEGHLRFSFAGVPENIVTGFDRLRAWFARQ